MIDETEILDELSVLDRYANSMLSILTELCWQIICSEIKKFPRDAHWFCPRQEDRDPADYDHPDEDEEDISAETKQKHIKDGKIRHEKAYKYAAVLGLAPEIAGRALEDYCAQLNRLLTCCDKCVHNWHLGRKAYLKELAE